MQEFDSRRSAVYGRGGMVAASQPLAVAAGLLTLEKGGTAADAAIAAAAALGVTEPFSTGLGGDAFALYYHAGEKKVYALNGSGRAPAFLTLEKVHAQGFSTEIPPRHPFSVTVPGACAAWCDLLDVFGRLSLVDVLEPAIILADEGFPVAPITAHQWGLLVEKVLLESYNGKEFTIEGRAPRAGEIFRNPGLANSMQRIAKDGKPGFYQGETAAAILAALADTGGCMTKEDLATHESTWENPLSVQYHDLRVWECPPNGQGLAALLALNLVEGLGITSMPALSAERLHLLIESMRLAFADVRTHVADPKFYKVPLEEILNKEYADRRRLLIKMDRANPAYISGIPAGRSDTVYLSVVDRQGNACSFINSTYMGFGSGIVPLGCGFALQNRGNNFSLDAHHPNVLTPGKRPYHTIIPAMATRVKDNSLYGPFGVMGGFMQPQGHLQVVIGMADDGLDPQAALDRPRFCVDGENLGGWVALEEGIPVGVMARLCEMGHQVRPISGPSRTMFGKGQIILRNPESGVLIAGSDPRSDGCAMCLH